jgi:SAM-dependent methyltransferase
MLSQERAQSATSLDQHTIDVFRRIRSNQEPSQAVGLFLFFLAMMLEKADNEAIDRADDIIARHGIQDVTGEHVRAFGSQFWADGALRFRHPIFSRDSLSTLPSLVVRHAGARIFQEAHFELLRAGDKDLFDFAAPAIVQVNTRGGVHFTPPGLARSLTERAVAETQNRDSISILDPACGSGAFLVEAARHIIARIPEVKLTLIGFDVSPFAIAMARFALGELQRDGVANRVTVDLHLRDALSIEPWPKADLILTNPPFVAWPELTSEQQKQVKEIIHNDRMPQRPDLSMAFVSKGLASLKEDGVLGSLIPGGILSMETAAPWRKSLLDKASVSFVAVLGEHTLFEYATVEVGAIVLRSGTDVTDCISVWSGPRRGASSEALRELRRQSDFIERAADEQGDWSIYRIPAKSLNSEFKWRPRPYRLVQTLAQIERSTPTRIGDLFHIKQGVRTGHRSAFMLKEAELQSLPKAERRFFRPVVENDNIRNGRIIPGQWIFFPETDGLPSITTDKELSQLLPTFRKRLITFRQELEARKGNYIRA